MSVVDFHCSVGPEDLYTSVDQHFALPSIYAAVWSKIGGTGFVLLRPFDCYQSGVVDRRVGGARRICVFVYFRYSGGECSSVPFELLDLSFRAALLSFAVSPCGSRFEQVVGAVPWWNLYEVLQLALVVRQPVKPLRSDRVSQLVYIWYCINTGRRGMPRAFVVLVLDSFGLLKGLRNGSFATMGLECKSMPKIVTGAHGYVLEDVPHLSDYIPNLPVYPNPLEDNPAYSAVRQYFVHVDDSVPEKVVVHKDSPRGVHFRRAGPREKVYFESEDVNACIVTCGGLCPGLNTVIREIVCGLHHMYGVKRVIGINGGYRGFYSKNTVSLTPNSVNDIHKRGGTILGTSRGGHDTKKIVDSIQDRGINQVYIIGGDGTQKGAAVIFEEVKRRGLKVAVAGIPKTIDNDIPVIDKSFGFDSAVEEAQRAINAAHVEATSIENGIGFVKLMGRYSGFIVLYATLASRDVDCCLIPESPFYLEGPGGLFEYIEKRLKEQGHMVIVMAEGAGQELLSEDFQTATHDASGNKLLDDCGLWMCRRIKDYFSKKKKMAINLKYIDPTYMIRAIPSNASDNVYCTLLAQSAVHGAMAGFTGFTVGLVNGRQTYIPFYRINEVRNHVIITDRMWARLLSSTNQPSFLSPKQANVVAEMEHPDTQLLDDSFADGEKVIKDITF
ncbi:6-phosphofructokinase 3 [Dorcoceras hygrometricum]|uniref:ATP-dependent 6-phosphofructokinase n=1 Tax=Dorcoceras hygrometricum TaxID=472368 RepID=A0A2Z7D3S4_9LAMI|nr:6-phosphofructokinase 3 [Dorcoceras hygrometricum]